MLPGHCKSNSPDEAGQVFRLETSSVNSPPLVSSSQTPPFWQGLFSQAPAFPQHWYTPNTLLLPGPAHSDVSPTLICSPFSSRASRQPMKLCGRWWTSGDDEAKSRAPWERIRRHGSDRPVKAGWCWSRVSLMVVELTSSRTLCHWPSDTGSDLISNEPGEAFPQLYLKRSCPSVSWRRKTSNKRRNTTFNLPETSKLRPNEGYKPRTLKGLKLFFLSS